MDIKALISKMSFREKVYQLLQLTSDFFSGSGDVDLTGPIQDFKIAPDNMKLIGSVLTPREEEIIVLRYGLRGYKPETQRGVAKHLGISRSYVSRIEKRALLKLRDSFGGDVPSFDY